VRLERYIKDMLIEMHTLREMIDTLVLPAAYEYAGTLGQSAANAKTAGIKVVPQVEAANRIGEYIAQLETHRTGLIEAIEKAEGLHHDVEKLAQFLTSEGATRMAEVRKCSDALELVVSDDVWPLPKYREMLFPV
jgi:glutamine synthetase